MGESDGALLEDIQKREVFPFQIFIKEEYLREGIASKSEREDILRETGIENIQMDGSIFVPDVPGQVMIIECKDIVKREDALKAVLTRIDRLQRQSGTSKSDKIELMTFIPEGLVGVTIGPNGRMIQKIQNETGISVVIN